ncbi:Cyclin-dependent kinase 10 [Coemansia sp. RSA 2671]|nr:Cyclin-dependent kinase 10 [Coemansia sp. RSA 2675]KAJ2344605.1 Cyclin-dependent kinase 10 [Coemansia sp. RSA 2671]
MLDFAGRQVSLPCNGFLGACTDVDAYDKLNRIGEGTYGIVYRAQHRRSGSIVALKRMRVDVGSGSSHGLPLSSFREIALLTKFYKYQLVSIVRSLF